MKNTNQNRRRFLKQAAKASLLGSGMGAMGGKLNIMSSALAASGDYAGLNDYKALVCIFLYGGSDSYNMFIPYDAGGHQEYAQSRGDLSLARDTLLPTADSVVGFNPNMPGLRDLYDNGRLSLVANVGNLIVPVTRSSFQAESIAVPSDLFAHNHQQEQWQKGLSSQPTSIVGSGWGGRMADLLMEANGGSDLPATFSVNGSNAFLPGNIGTPISINPQSGPSLMAYLDNSDGQSRNNARAESISRIMAIQDEHLIKQFVANSFLRARDSSQLISEVLRNSPTFATPFDDTSRVATQLRMVARMIAGREALGMKRQVFFVGMGGWDTHDYQTPRLIELTQELDAALTGFQQTLGELNIEDSVTSFTASDFGRTLTVNGNGSDHGWSGHYMVMGGAVNGGQMIGDWPDFSIGGSEDIGSNGRLIPRMSINEYGAALGTWMGLSPSDMADVFPDLQNFSSDWQNSYGLFRN